LKDGITTGQVGLVENSNKLGDLVSEGVRKIATDLPGMDASHRDWVDLAHRLGEVICKRCSDALL
jgi:hypothetical protein